MEVLGKRLTKPMSQSLTYKKSRTVGNEHIKIGREAEECKAAKAWSMASVVHELLCTLPLSDYTAVLKYINDQRQGLDSQCKGGVL